MPKDYREPEDLLSDESFLAWYALGKSNDAAWDSWMAEDPARKALVEQAVAFLDATRMEEKPLPAEQVRLAEAALMQRVGELDRQHTPGAKKKRASVPLYRSWRWIAAACILFLLAGSMVLIRAVSGRQQQLTTGYGQLASKQLPDGSEVTMNANSRLRYFTNWQDGADREVWIDGEAFFHVRKTQLKSRFIVHTDQFDVVVTGTQFNVVNRHGKNNVLLQEGSVIVHPRAGEDVRMVPGDFVQWNGNRLAKTAVRLDSLTAWQQHQLVLDKTPLREIARIIEDQYGVKVILQDPGIGDSTVTGILPNNNLNVLLQALQTTSDFDVIRDGGTITIRASVH
jgi:transmembrane sensor